jgi:hypothetical protein
LEATTDPESQIDLILGLDLTSQTDRIATKRVLNRSHAHRSDFDLLGLFLAARGKQESDRDDEQNLFHRDITSFNRRGVSYELSPPTIHLEDGTRHNSVRGSAIG